MTKLSINDFIDFEVSLISSLFNTNVTKQEFTNKTSFETFDMNLSYVEPTCVIKLEKLC